MKKRFYILLFFLVMLFPLFSCSDKNETSTNEPEHTVCVDTNEDLFCDECGKAVEPEHTVCVDTNEDLFCDECGKAVEPEKKGFVVTFLVDGVDYDKRTYFDGDDELPSAPEKIGFRFVGWYTDEGDEFDASFLDSDVTVYAKFDAIKYSITYHLNNTNARNENRSEYTIESEDFSIAAPISDSDIFIGWFLDSELTVPAGTIVQKGSHGNLVLYAKWECSHEYVYSEGKEAGVLVDGYVKYKCIGCEAEKEETLPATKTVKLLAIGNSFSIDALEHFCKILEDAGVENIIIANLYEAGCSIDGHLEFIESGAAEYTLYLSSSDNKMVAQSEKVTLEYGLELEKWDIITMQQASGKSGKPTSYGRLGELVEYVREYQPKAKLYWHMTWAYDTWYLEQSSSGDSAAMYSSIVDAVTQKIIGNEDFVKIIPAGTAIQNIRTSYIGDNLTRDGYHLSKGIGRYTAALTWFALICESEIDHISWTPSAYPEIAENITVIKEAVKNAISSPYKITESLYPPTESEGGDEPDEPVVPDEPEFPESSTAILLELSADDIEYLTGKGLDANKYKLLSVTVYENQYYNSTSSSRLATGTEENGLINTFIATEIFSKDELILGSIIRLESGYRYRAEGWVALDKKNSSAERPKNVSTSHVIVDEEWWGSFNYRAFNLSKSGSTVSAEDISALRIYVPVA